MFRYVSRGGRKEKEEKEEEKEEEEEERRCFHKSIVATATLKCYFMVNLRKQWHRKSYYAGIGFETVQLLKAN